MGTKTLTQKLIENKPYIIKSRCDGKYDFVNTHTFTKANPSYTIDMVNYDGLSYEYDSEKEVYNFANTVLPWEFDYNSTLNVSRFALVDHSKTRTVTIYEDTLNGTVSGNPTISNDFVLSGNYSQQDYFITPAIDYSSPFHMEMPISLTSISNGWPFKSSVSSSLDTYFGYGNMIMAVGNGSQYHDLTISSVIPFEGKMILDWSGSVYTYTLVSNTGTVYGTQTWSSTSVIPSSPMQIGYSKNSTYRFDLKGFKFESQDPSKSYYAVIRTPISSETLPGCLYNYTDNGSSATLNCFTYNKDESVVLTSDASISGERLLGTVNVPAHTVYSDKTLTINTTPNEAEVEFVVDGQTYAGSKSYSTTEDSADVQYTVTLEGYESQRNTVTLTSDTTINVTLNATDSYIDVAEYGYTTDGLGNVVLTNYNGTNNNVVVPTIQRS